MTTTHRFTILGCGSSGGVPRLGGHCGACDPENPKNYRRRCSMLVEREGEGGTNYGARAMYMGAFAEQTLSDDEIQQITEWFDTL